MSQVRPVVALVGGMVWYGMVWYGMVWYGMVWYRSVDNHGGAETQHNVLRAPWGQPRTDRSIVRSFGPRPRPKDSGGQCVTVPLEHPPYSAVLQVPHSTYLLIAGPAGAAPPSSPEGRRGRPSRALWRASASPDERARKRSDGNTGDAGGSPRGRPILDSAPCAMCLRARPSSTELTSAPKRIEQRLSCAADCAGLIVSSMIA